MILEKFAIWAVLGQIHGKGHLDKFAMMFVFEGRGVFDAMVYW